MASTIESPGSQQYVDFDEYIDYQLQKTRGSIKSIDILTAFAFVTAFVLAYLLLFVIGDHWLVPDGFSQTTRVVLLSVVGLISGGWLVWKVVWPYLRQVNQLFAAKLIEKSQPELRSTLLNLIDARSAGKELSPEILSAMEKRAAISLSHTNVDEAVDRRPLMGACYAILGLVVLFSLYTLMTPKKVSSSIWRGLFPAAAVDAPTRTVVENVKPGDVEVIPGERLEVTADISGEIPEKITLHYTTKDREFVDEPVEMREDPEVPQRYRARIIGANGEGIQQNLSYHIRAGDDRSSSYNVTVFHPPSAEIVELHYSYPEYMERDAKTRASGNIDDYEGVIVTFLAESNMPLRTATITFHDDQGTNYRAEAIPMSPINAEQTRFRANWILNISERNGTYPRYYTIECKNERGDSDPNPTRWPIRIHPDKPPEAQIVNPAESELERPANAVLPVTAYARDDFKVASLSLWKQLNDEPPVKHKTLFEGAEASLSVGYDWRLNEGWELNVGDEVSYWFKAEDNRTPKAGKINSDKKTILIQAERPEEEVQQQLENDRRPEQQQSGGDESEKNAQDERNGQSERPQDDGMGDEKRGPKQPMPQEDQPQQEQTGESGEAGDSEAKQGGRGESESQKNEGGEGQPVKNDGSEDGEALEKLHQHFNKNQPEPDPEDSKTGPKQDRQDSEQEGSENSKDQKNKSEPDKSGEKSDEKSEQKPNGTDPQDPQKPGEKPQDPGDSPKKEPGEEPSGDKPEAEKDDAENAQDDPSQPSGMGESPNPENSEDAETGEEPKPEPGDKKPGDSKAPADEQKPMPGDADSPPNQTPGDQGKPGGGDQKSEGGKPGDSSDPSATKNEMKPGSEDTKPSDPGEGENADKPLNGKETPGDPDQDAEKRSPTGDEKGPGSAEDDPDAETKPAKNNIDRKDSEKPTATKERDGDPDDVPEKTPKKTDDPNAKPGDEDAGSRNSEDATDKKPAEKNTNPEEKPAKTPETDPDREPANSEDQPNTGDDDLKGRGRPEGQEAKKPSGGEAGGSKQNKEGTPGGNEKGPGDRAPKAGDKEPSEKPNGGKPSQETGEGSRTRPTDQTQDGGPQRGNPPADSDPDKSPKTQKPEDTPGEPGAEGTPGQPSREQPANQRTGEAGPPDFGGNSQGEGPATPETARAAEKENLEYGRKATDLALKRLEDELQRGEVNEDWLKEMGWDEADASQFLDRMKNRMNRGDESTPEARAKQRQFNEWLKRLNKPDTNTIRRSGDSVRNRGPRDLIDSRKSAPPAELRDIYEAYQRGISERAQ